MPGLPWQTIRLPQDAAEILASAPGVNMAASLDELRGLKAESIADPMVPAIVSAPTPEYISIDPLDPLDRRQFAARFECDLASLRAETFQWLKSRQICAFPLRAAFSGAAVVDAMVLCPASAGQFALGLAAAQDILPPESVPEDFSPRTMIYFAPSFQYTHFDSHPKVLHVHGDRVDEFFCYHPAAILPPIFNKSLVIH